MAYVAPLEAIDCVDRALGRARPGLTAPLKAALDGLSGADRVELGEFLAAEMEALVDEEIAYGGEC